MIRMDEANKMKKFHREGYSINEIAKRFNRSWETVKNTVEKSTESLQSRGKRPHRQRKVITPSVIKAIDDYLDKETQCDVWKKQHYTSAYIFNELKNNNIYFGSKRQLQDAVKMQRKQRGQYKTKSYLPLEFPLGTVAQFDHGEVDCIIDGKQRRFYLFVCSIPNASLRYCQVFPIKQQEAWGEFHERTYRFFGGIFPVNVYDNDSVLVKKILGSKRKQTSFSLALEDHYKTTSRFCNIASGNEKGAVENGVGYCRRNYLPGLPQFDSWSEINEFLEISCKREIDQKAHYRTDESLKKIFNDLRVKLKPLSPLYHWRRSLELLVNHWQLVSIDGHRYSVPEKYVGNRILAQVYPFSITLYSEGEEIVCHHRKFKKGEDSLCLDHYLDQLQRKPGAVWDCKPVQQHYFNNVFLKLGKCLEERYPQKNEANRRLIETIILHRKFGMEKLVEGVQKAFDLQVYDPDAIEAIIRNLSEDQKESNEIPIEDFLHIKIETWECNTEKYEQLAQGGF